MSNCSLYVDKHNGLAVVEFGHPSANCMPLELLKRLSSAFRDLASDDSINVIVLKSEGSKIFCSGASFDELLKITNFDEGYNFFCGFADLILAMKSCKKIIIGKIHGKAIGGGVGIVAACDYTFADESSSIRLPEVSIAIGPFVIQPVLCKKIGAAAFSELTLDTEWKSAYWAKEKGLYTKVYDNASDMGRDLDFFASKLASYNPNALTQLKAVFWEGTESWETLLPERAKISGELILSEQGKTVISKLKSKDLNP